MLQTSCEVDIINAIIMDVQTKPKKGWVTCPSLYSFTVIGGKTDIQIQVCLTPKAKFRVK